MILYRLERERERQEQATVTVHIYSYTLYKMQILNVDMLSKSLLANIM